jgi:peptide-methionine (S)-S-oxide reductase
MQFFRPSAPRMPTSTDALPGRSQTMAVPERHFVNGASLTGPWPDGTRTAIFALGYAGGFTPNPTYREVCSGKTGHAEAVLVAYDPSKVSYEQLLKVFWEHHDPTQGMRQGNDVGTQYRSAIYATDDEQLAAAKASRDMYQKRLNEVGFGEISTEIAPAPEFYYAEDYHQQYLAKNPFGYCPDHSTGVSCPVGLGVATESVARA